MKGMNEIDTPSLWFLLLLVLHYSLLLAFTVARLLTSVLFFSFFKRKKKTGLMTFLRASKMADWLVWCFCCCYPPFRYSFSSFCSFPFSASLPCWRLFTLAQKDIQMGQYSECDRTESKFGAGCLWKWVRNEKQKLNRKVESKN